MKIIKNIGSAGYPVWGYIRQIRNKMNIPHLIYYICLSFWWIEECFVNIHPNAPHMEICDDGASIKMSDNGSKFPRYQRMAVCKLIIDSAQLQSIKWNLKVEFERHDPGIEFSISAGLGFDDVQDAPSYHWTSGGATTSMGLNYTGPSHNPVYFFSGDTYTVMLDTKEKTIDVIGRRMDASKDEKYRIFKNINTNKIKYRLFISLRDRQSRVKIVDFTRQYY